MALHPPTLTTARLTLGPLTMPHFDAFKAFAATDRSVFMGGPTTDAREVWDSCVAHAGQWQMRGYGGFFVSETATGTPVGRVSLRHPIDLDEPELSWVVYEGFEGKGHAAEAVLAVRDFARTTLALPPLMSLIAPENTRSIALARRLGCVDEGPARTGGTGTVHRWRHPVSEEAAA